MTNTVNIFIARGDEDCIVKLAMINV